MIALTPQELELYRQCINEVLRGYHAPDLEAKLGVSYSALMKEDKAFYTQRLAQPEGQLGSPEIPLRAPVIAEAIRQLGADDFQIRTGCSLAQGYLLLEKATKA